MSARGDPRGYYRELGVHRTASAEEIRSAFRERAKLCHPDQSGQGDDRRFKRLAEAYEVLKDPRRRLQYDAEGLAAERDQERARRLAEAIAGGRGERAWPEPAAPPARSAESAATTAGEAPRAAASAIARQHPPVVADAAPRWLLPVAAALALVAVLGLSGFAWAWSRLGHKDEQLSQLADRHNAAVLRLADLESRYRARSIALIDEPPLPPGPSAGRTLFQGELAFPLAATDLDASLQAALEQAVIGLSRALRTVPEREDWAILVDGYAGRAADAAGVAVPDWENALLRLGVVVDRLVAQGVPGERIAARFQAGFAPAGPAAVETPVVELKLVCCFR
jgi:curved DNA-binding protein CbpA